MSKVISLTEVQSVDIFTAFGTDGLRPMAAMAGIEEELFDPESIGITTAQHLIQPLQEGLDALNENAAYIRRYEPEPGAYEQFVQFLETYIMMCKKHPEAKVSVR